MIVNAFLADFGALALLKALHRQDLSRPAIVLSRMYVNLENFKDERTSLFQSFRGSPIPPELRDLSNEYLIQPIKRRWLFKAIRQLFPAESGGDPALALTKGKVSRRDFNYTADPSIIMLLAEDNPIVSVLQISLWLRF